MRSLILHMHQLTGVYQSCFFIYVGLVRDLARLLTHFLSS